MSWDAYLIDDRGHYDGEWNYTHNCNGMANAALYEDPPDAEQPSTFDEVFRPTRESWWKLLDGMSGPLGAAMLDRIIKRLEADPQRFRAMNPANGWGDYDSFLKTLTEMRNAVPEWPTKWEVYG